MRLARPVRRTANVRVAAAAGLLLLAAACGRGEDRAGQPTSEEAEKLDNMAGKMEAEDGTDVYDTSPDSKVPAEGPSPQAAPANGAAPAPAANANGQNKAN